MKSAHMTSSRLTNRRGRVPKPAVCISKQKWFDQQGNLVPIPNQIQGFLQILYQITAPPVLPVNDRVILTRQGTSLEWEFSGVSGNNILYADAILDPIDSSWTLDVIFIYNVTPTSQNQADRTRPLVTTAHDVINTASFNLSVTPSIIAAASFGINF